MSVKSNLWILRLIVGRCLLLCCFMSEVVLAQSNGPESKTAPAPSQAIDSTFAEARQLLQKGKKEEALAKLQDLSDQNPQLKGLSHELGAAYYQTGDYVKAIDNLKKAVAEDPADKEGIQLLGLSYYLAGRPADAIPELEKVHAWYPRANV